MPFVCPLKLEVKKTRQWCLDQVMFGSLGLFPYSKLTEVINVKCGKKWQINVTCGKNLPVVCWSAVSPSDIYTLQLSPNSWTLLALVPSGFIQSFHLWLSKFPHRPPTFPLYMCGRMISAGKHQQSILSFNEQSNLSSNLCSVTTTNFLRHIEWGEDLVTCCTVSIKLHWEAKVGPQVDVRGMLPDV